MTHIGEIRHESLTVKREAYDGDDWEDHVIHIWDGDGFLGVGGVKVERPVFTLSEWEALELIELLAKAVREG